MVIICIRCHCLLDTLAQTPPLREWTVSYCWKINKPQWWSNRKHNTEVKEKKSANGWLVAGPGSPFWLAVALQWGFWKKIENLSSDEMVAVSIVFTGDSLTSLWQIPVTQTIGRAKWDGLRNRVPLHMRSQRGPLKNEARCNAAFLCSFWACDSCGGMDLYPSYTERAAELDGALKWSKKALENRPSKAHLNWKAFLLSCHSLLVDNPIMASTYCN